MRQSHSQTNDYGLWSGNETMCVHVYKIRKWVTTQQTAVSSAVNSFIDQGKFEAMKMLSGCKAPRL